MAGQNGLQQQADAIRREVMQVSIENRAGHIAPSLSCVDILCALYYQSLNYDFSDPTWEGRDRLIFSKSHGCYGLYAILADRGLIPREIWQRFYADGSGLSGCVEKNLAYGIEAGCGSLGHGLPLAVGAAFGAALQGQIFHTFCLMGDGETQEGSTWEALQFALKHRLANLTLIVDCNRLQAMEFVEDVMGVTTDELERRLRGFGFEPLRCNGHDVRALADLFDSCREAGGERPQVVLAETTKGFGLNCMEDVPRFHFRVPPCGELG